MYRCVHLFQRDLEASENFVRPFQIFLLLFIMLYLASYALIEKFRRKDHEDCYSTDEDEITVYRISVWLCTFALAVTVGSLLLLPISIVSNEVLLIYPDSYYVKWLNSSLIQGEPPVKYRRIKDWTIFLIQFISQVCGIMCFCFQICRCSCCCRLLIFSPNRPAFSGTVPEWCPEFTRLARFSPCWPG